MSDWIEQDVGCVTARAKLRFPSLLLMAVGHSVGGHAILLSTATRSLHAAVLVASHAGVTRTIQQTQEKLRVWFYYVFWRRFCVVPLAICLPDASGWGRFTRARHAAMGALECHARLFYDDRAWDARRRASEVTLPLLVLGFDDDPGLILQRLRA